MRDSLLAGSSKHPTASPGYASTSTMTAATAQQRFTAKCVARGLIIVTIVVVLIALPIAIWELKTQAHTENHIVAWFAGGVFSLLAIMISMYDISEHLLHYGRPVLQRYMIRIMWMVPIYAVESWLSLRFKKEHLYIETARECYEAYVIYSFTYFMMYYCARDGEAKFLEELASRDPHHGAHLPPFKWCMKQWKLGPEFMNKCKAGALQYVVIRVVCTLLTFILALTHKYCDGELTNFGCGYIYITFIVNCSQIWAMYCLVLFYHATYKDLAPLKPFPKFVCIKAVVFFSFWQAVGIAIMVKLGWIHATLTYTTDEVAAGLQDFIICIEMFLAAIAHHFFYSYKDIIDPSAVAHTGFVTAFLQSSMPTDVVQDVMSHTPISHSGSTTSARGSGKSAPRGSTKSAPGSSSGDTLVVVNPLLGEAKAAPPPA